MGGGPGSAGGRRTFALDRHARGAGSAAPRLALTLDGSALSASASLTVLASLLPVSVFGILRVSRRVRLSLLQKRWTPPSGSGFS